jgi:hypothetical protein
MSLSTSFESPQSLAELIERHVRSRTGGQIRALRVDVAQGEVVISGRAPTYYTKQLATHAARDAVEHLVLTNEIEVC